MDHLPDHPFRGRDAASHGLSPKALRLAVSQGLVRRLFSGTYVRSGVPDTILLRAQAARLVMNPRHVLCDRTAAWLHGVDLMRYAELDGVPPLETFVLRGHRPTDRQDCHGRTRDLLPEDVVMLHGVPVTTPLRTAVDLACGRSRREALAALDALAREFDLDPADMNRLLIRRYRRRRGVVQARELVQLTDGRSESRGESWTRLAIHDEGLPPPEPQVWVHVDGVPTYRLDLAYRRARVCVEYDGEEWHADPHRRASDARRRRWLREQGWHVIVLTKPSFTPEALASWLGELRDVLRARGVLAA